MALWKLRRPVASTRPSGAACYAASALSDHAATILVTGANGQLGRRLIRRLAESGRRARAVVRSQRAADSLAALREALGFEICIVDYADADRITEAARGCAAAVHLVGILKETRSNRYADAHERPCEALVSASRAAGLARIVSLSILGSRADSSNACLASKGRAEEILLSGPVPALVIRVPMVLGAGDPASAALRRQASSGRTSLVRGGDTREQPIAADDVVAAILGGLDAAEPMNEALDLAGPESLSHRSLVVRAAAVLGTEVTIGRLPLLAAQAFAGLAERFVADPPLTRAMLGVLEHDDDIDPHPAAAKLGISLTPLDEALRRCFGDGDTEA